MKCSGVTGVSLAESSRRTIALDPETVEALLCHRDAQLLERDFAGGAYDDQDLVFCDEVGGTIHPNRLTEWFKSHREDAGIPTGTLHILRHTAATLALTSGVPVHIVAARLGDDPKTCSAPTRTCCRSRTRSPRSA
jgi:integrase